MIWKTLGGLLVALLLGSGYLVWWVKKEIRLLQDDDPRVWSDVIQRFAAEDREQGFPEDAVLFVGSSSIRFWRRLSEDMAPVPIIRRGFGGAKLPDVIHYFDSIVKPYHPRAIVLYAGMNDIAGFPNDKTPEEVLRLFRVFSEKVARELPGTPLYYLAISPTIKRWAVWPQCRRANELIEAYTRTQPHLQFIDTASRLIAADGRPRRELYFWDKTHLNRDGYRMWTEMIKPVLQKDLYE